ncbi:MAG: ATP-dependent protease La [Chlamydiales bacterium]|jgi:ATP-dependent Lon protease|nr:ATP-dependent protease La [Chlamydiales bacterium]
MSTTLDNKKTNLAQIPIPNIIPVLPLLNSVAYPGTLIPLVIAQNRAIKLINDVMHDNRLVMLVAQKDENIIEAGPDDLYSVGTICVIHKLSKDATGQIHLVVQGLERARIMHFVETEDYLIADVDIIQEEPLPINSETEVMQLALLNLFERSAQIFGEITQEIIAKAKSLKDARQLAYFIALTIPYNNETRQDILEYHAVEFKFQRLIELLQQELTLRELGDKIVNDTHERVLKTQKEYFLKEQVKAIQKELGENPECSEVGILREKLEKTGLPREAFKEAERELNRMAALSSSSSEYGIIRNYLDWIVSLPWNNLTGGIIDLGLARKVLDEDHYDLDKIKDRILEYLAVRKLRMERQLAAADGKVHLTETSVEDYSGVAAQSASFPHLADLTLREPILCFLGPPGVGKTSLGQSIAKALGRKFIRIALGGLHDESEIRGHRKTYIGAMPGRIIQGLKRAEAKDAVFMLDEIDKLGNDWRGDPSAALLEVLDPAQNHSFIDNYLGIAFDLSKVLFIATANSLDTIPAPLLDRMEVIRLSGYTDDDKLNIAIRYLVSKEVLAHGLNPNELTFENQAIKRIIRGYTREAGVRGLDREISAICRKVARKIAEGDLNPVHITAEQIGNYLGPQKYFDEVAERTQRAGVSTGLAWTATGGDVLFIEATMMLSRNEQLILTGMLGDVMRESAQAALSYLKSNYQILQINPKVFENQVFHIHVPAGAIPKDGPSAGVTMITALTSLLRGIPVRDDIAMTGEMTLRGRVLPVGGIKEKVLAAHRAGIKLIIIPRHNESDLEEVPLELRREIKFILVDTVEEVLESALGIKVLEAETPSNTLPTSRRNSKKMRDDDAILVK